MPASDPTFIIAGALTAGDLNVVGCDPHHLDALLQKLTEVSTSNGVVKGASSKGSDDFAHTLMDVLKEVNTSQQNAATKPAVNTVTIYRTTRREADGAPADFGKLIADDSKKWSQVVVAANLQPK